MTLRPRLLVTFDKLNFPSDWTTFDSRLLPPNEGKLVSPRDASFWSTFGVETVELAVVELTKGRSNLDKTFLSNVPRSFACFDVFRSRTGVNLDGSILTFDSEAFVRPEVAHLNDIDLLILLAGPSIVSMEVCSLEPFCFWGTSSTCLTFGLEFKVLNELDFNKVPVNAEAVKLVLKVKH